MEAEAGGDACAAARTLSMGAGSPSGCEFSIAVESAMVLGGGVYDALQNAPCAADVDGNVLQRPFAQESAVGH